MAVQMTANQLTLDVADPDGSDDRVIPEPRISRFKVSVELSSVKKQLYAKDRVKLQLVDIYTGEVIAGAFAAVKQVAFPVLEKDGFEWTERVHTFKFGDELLLDQAR